LTLLGFAQFLIFLTVLGSRQPEAEAGHTLGGGDCWQSSTPLQCRTNWEGPGKILKLRIIDQMGNSGLTTRNQTAYTNWNNNNNGPQDFSTTVRTNDSHIYMKIDNGLGAPNGYEWECISSACPAPAPTNTLWSEIYVPEGNLTCGICGDGTVAIAIFAHELGHALGLEHHESSDALMQSMSFRQGPTSVDIGLDPPCSGASTTWGVRCIYRFTKPAVPSSMGTTFNVGGNPNKVSTCFSPVTANVPATYYRVLFRKVGAGTNSHTTVNPNTSCFGSVLLTKTLTAEVYHIAVEACNDAGCSQYRDTSGALNWWIPCSTGSGCPASGSASGSGHNH
jgi:hypothetical protein